ncbi:tyrosine-protein phosphatase [Galactobacillus timonensis]|uniref:tyrosine-protein phosphatase n=1 Tax=Galactobacillus timonensis TaxID=2041840 RepID=UPI000C81D6AE|nr:CpsB/CapC family capsule biosynthesis tyrosine phosphatase [Galactobacillus timonensis]
MKDENIKSPLADLHCHILPQIDDGAKDESISIKMLQMEYQSGVTEIAMTSHFDCEKIKLDDFLKKRLVAKKKLMSKAILNFKAAANINIKLGAEVYYSPNLSRIDAGKLCIEGTNFMLMELPTDRKPPYLDETIYSLQSMGITLLIAHIERYPYVMDNLPILCDWIDKGIFTQINAGTILRKGSQAKICHKLIKWNLVHVMASDAHSIDKRPPNLAEGLDLLTKDEKKRLIQNAHNIFGGVTPEITEIYCPKKFLGRWY